MVVRDTSATMNNVLNRHGQMPRGAEGSQASGETSGSKGSCTGMKGQHTETQKLELNATVVLCQDESKPAGLCTFSSFFSPPSSLSDYKEASLLREVKRRSGATAVPGLRGRAQV